MIDSAPTALDWKVEWLDYINNLLDRLYAKCETLAEDDEDRDFFEAAIEVWENHQEWMLEAIGDAK